MRHGGGGNGNLGSLERIVVHGIIKSVGRILHHRNHFVVVLGVDEVNHLLAFKSRRKRLDLVGIFIAFLDDQHIHIGRLRAFQRERVLGGAEFGFERVVGVDDRVIHIGQDVGHLRRFYLFELDVLGILGNIQHSGGDIGVVLELDVAQIVEQEQRSAAVGRVVGDRDGNGSVGFRPVGAVRLLVTTGGEG